MCNNPVYEYLLLFVNTPTGCFFWCDCKSVHPPWYGSRYRELYILMQIPWSKDPWHLVKQGVAKASITILNQNYNVRKECWYVFFPIIFLPSVLKPSYLFVKTMLLLLFYEYYFITLLKRKPQKLEKNTNRNIKC